MMYKSREEATSKAQMILDKLPKGWSMQVWTHSNRWHSRVTKGYIVVYELTSGVYRATILFRDNIIRENNTSDSDPNVAVQLTKVEAFARLNDEISKLTETLAEIMKV